VYHVEVPESEGESVHPRQVVQLLPRYQGCPARGNTEATRGYCYSNYAGTVIATMVALLKEQCWCWYSNNAGSNSK